MPKLMLVIVTLGVIAHAQVNAPFITPNVDTKAGLFKDMDDKGPKRGVCLFVTRPCETDPSKTMSAIPGRCNTEDPPYTIFQVLPTKFCAIGSSASQDSTQLRIIADIPEPLITFLENTKASFDTDSIKIAQKFKLTTENGWSQDDKDKFKIRGFVQGQSVGQLRIEAKVCTLCP